MSVAQRWNSADFGFWICDFGLAVPTEDLAALRWRVASAAKPSSHSATSNGEYLPLASPATTSAAYSSMVANSSGSSGLTLPKRLGRSVSLYGWPSSERMGMLVYTSGHRILQLAEAP